MTSDVLISINGLCGVDGESDTNNLLAHGKYYKKNNRHYLLFDDRDPSGNVMKSTIRIEKDRVDIIRHGATDLHMIFISGEESIAAYPTPAGILGLSIFTSEILTSAYGDILQTTLRYTLAFDGAGPTQFTVIITASPA